MIVYRRAGAVAGVVGINAGREIRLAKRSLENARPLNPPAARP
jgi:hypothetical protein